MDRITCNSTVSTDFNLISEEMPSLVSLTMLFLASASLLAFISAMVFLKVRRTSRQSSR